MNISRFFYTSAVSAIFFFETIHANFDFEVYENKNGNHVLEIETLDGECWTIIIDPDQELRLSNGHHNYPLKVQDIVELVPHMGKIIGQIVREGHKQKLDHAFLRDKYLSVEIAGMDQKIVLPWEKVAKISAKNSSDLIPALDSHIQIAEDSLQVDADLEKDLKPNSLEDPFASLLMQLQNHSVSLDSISQQISYPQAKQIEKTWLVAEDDHEVPKELIVAHQEALSDLEMEKEILEILEEMLVSYEKQSTASEMIPENMIYVPSTKLIVPICQVGQTCYPFVGNFIPAAEYPAQVITVGNFYADSSPVTNGEYLEFVNATKRMTPSHWLGGKIPDGLENAPVVNVSFHDAEAYASWVNKRLPTEFEWERAIQNLSNLEGLNFLTALHVNAIGYIPDQNRQIAEWTSSYYTLTHSFSRLFLEYLSEDKNVFNSNVKVVRQGSFDNLIKQFSIFYRLPMSRKECNATTGFRCISDKI